MTETTTNQNRSGRRPGKPNVVQFKDGTTPPAQPAQQAPQAPERPAQPPQAQPKTEALPVVEAKRHPTTDSLSSLLPGGKPKAEPVETIDKQKLAAKIDEVIPQAEAQEKAEAKAKQVPAAATAKAPKKESVQQLKNRLRNEAEREILNLPENKERFYKLADEKFKANGLKFERRLSDEEKAAREIAEKLAKYPSLREQFAGK